MGGWSHVIDRYLIHEDSRPRRPHFHSRRHNLDGYWQSTTHTIWPDVFKGKNHEDDPGS